MKTFTRIVLPILLVAAGVFGITFIRVYSPDDPDDSGGGGDGGKAGVVREPALKFFTTGAIASNEKSTPKHLWYWDSTIEIGTPGHFEFWCQNRHPEPVTVHVPGTNCQCAGAELAVVPPEAYQDYLLTSAIAGGPLCPLGPASAFVHAHFDRKLTWLPLYSAGASKGEHVIPAPGTTGLPQFGIVRVGWTPKGESGQKIVSADVYSTRDNDKVSSLDRLKAEVNVIPAFNVMRREGSQLFLGRELPVGEFRENAIAQRTMYVVSFTRTYLNLQLTSASPTPCVSWTKPVPVTDEEKAQLSAFVRGKDESLRRVKAAYRFDVTVKERTEIQKDGGKEIRQLDLGPIDHKINVEDVTAGNLNVEVSGRVLGDITILGGADAGRIDFGTFSADQGASKSVSLLADRPGFDLVHAENETMPNYLKVKFEPLKNTPDGRKQWRLQVSVPKQMLYGSFADSSAVVLKTVGPNPRRLRFPVRGMTFDSGTPRL